MPKTIPIIGEEVNFNSHSLLIHQKGSQAQSHKAIPPKNKVKYKINNKNDNMSSPQSIL